VKFKTIAALAIIAATPAIAADLKIPSMLEFQPKLLRNERNALADYLSKAKAGNVTVICAGPFCRALADDVVALFQSENWKVKTITHGGLGIDGVTGIRVNSCGMAGAAIADALKHATIRKVEMIDDGKCADGAEREIIVILGQPDA